MPGFVPVAGTTLSVKQTSAGAFTDVGCIEEIGLDRGTRPSNIVACISTAQKFKRPGITEPGSLTFSIPFDPGSDMVVWLAGELGQPPASCIRSWQVGYPETDETAAATDTFDGFVSAFSTDASDADGTLMGSLTVELVSLPTLADVVSG